LGVDRSNQSGFAVRYRLRKRKSWKDLPKQRFGDEVAVQTLHQPIAWASDATSKRMRSE
jgi:hypothetical protein